MTKHNVIETINKIYSTFFSVSFVLGTLPAYGHLAPFLSIFTIRHLALTTSEIQFSKSKVSI